VEDPAELDGAIREILAHPGPALLDVVTNTQELSMPPRIEAAHVKGFGLWAIRAVMNGRGDELVDLTVSNFLSR
jgi:pyruvate dehydrogenase (quinone)